MRGSVIGQEILIALSRSWPLQLVPQHRSDAVQRYTHNQS